MNYLKILSLSVILVAIITSFTGCQELSSFKDKAVDYIDGVIKSVKNYTNNTTNATDITKTTISITPTITSEKQNETQKILSLGQQVLALVNIIRNDKGISALSWDDKLYEYSLEHSQAMAKQRDLFHSDMNLPYAENAWGGEGSKSWGAETIVDSWMNSPKHRTWLLCPNLKHVAVGIAYSSNGMYASWTFWRSETTQSDWWYQYTPDSPPIWWYWEE
jgi:uncharacterized protein YkwD